MTPRRLVALTSVMGLLTGNAMAQDFNAAPPNAPDQQPAFENQTRAPVLADDAGLQQTVVAMGWTTPGAWRSCLMAGGF